MADFAGGYDVLLWVAIALITWVVPKAMRDATVRRTLQEVVTDRLLREHSSEQGGEEKTTSALTLKCESIYCEQKSGSATLHDLLRKADSAVNQAYSLFKERAYTPFWDSVEDAVELLRQFDRRVSHINQSAKEYYGSLAGREHTFPTFPVDSRDIPSPDALVKRLGDSIAVAQRDFQFAQIFEQRRTTSAIVTGFRNTQEAITSLRNDIVSSLSDLQSSLESGLENISSNIQGGFADVAERHEQSATELRETLDRNAKEVSERDTKHHKFTEAALDNIQNRRKPRMSETKEPFRPSGD